MSISSRCHIPAPAKLKSCKVLALGIAVLTLSFDAQAQNSIFAIPYTPVSGSFIYSNSISEDGTVVVGSQQSGGVYEAFRWTSAGGLVLLGTLGGDSRGESVSSDGSIVAGYSYPSGSAAFSWNNVDGMNVVGSFGGNTSSASAISGDGSTIVASSQNRAFKIDSGGTTELDPLDSGSSVAYGVNADGTVAVGFSIVSGGSQAVRWIGTTAENLGVMPGYLGGSALDVSDDGTVIVGYQGDGSVIRAFRWAESIGFTDLGSRVGWSRAGTISGDGVLMGGYDDAGATIWDMTYGLRDLRDTLIDLGVDMSDWSALSHVSDIEFDGTNYHLTGGGTYEGENQVFVATLSPSAVPEPATVLLTILGLTGVASLRRRERR